RQSGVIGYTNTWRLSGLSVIFGARNCRSEKRFCADEISEESHPQPFRSTDRPSTILKNAPFGGRLLDSHERYRHNGGLRCSCRHVRLGSLLMLRMDDMNADLSRREPLNVTAEPGHDLLKTDVFHVIEAVRAKDRGDTSRLEAADPPLVDLL